MRKFMSQLWQDEAGFIVSTELIFVATIVVIGMITGLSTVRDQVNSELADVADAVSEIDQSFSMSAVTAHAASTSGIFFDDSSDFCETAGNVNDQGGAAGTQCLVVTTATAVAPE
jgi:Flp pilus assembly pilin Flp